MTPPESKKKKKAFFCIALSEYARRSSLPAWWDEDSRFDCRKLADNMNYKCPSTVLPPDWRDGKPEELGTPESREDMNEILQENVGEDRQRKANLTLPSPQEVYIILIGDFERWQETLDEPLPDDMKKRTDIFKEVLEAMAIEQLPDWWTSENKKECTQFAI